RALKKQDVGPVTTLEDTKGGPMRQAYNGPGVSLRISLSILFSQAPKYALVREGRTWWARKKGGVPPEKETAPGQRRRGGDVTSTCLRERWRRLPASPAPSPARVRAGTPCRASGSAAASPSRGRCSGRCRPLRGPRPRPRSGQGCRA